MRKLTLLLISFSLVWIPQRLLSYAEVAFGANAGYIPSIGGNMSSYVQSSQLGVNNGIDGINRSQDGVDTKNIGKLIGVAGGGELRVIILSNFLVRLGADYARSVYGGKGKTIDMSGAPVKAEYSIWYFDIPLTVGLSIPFWKDVRISLSGGIAYAQGVYSNSFKSSALDSTASFSGWALPKVIILSGEYFMNNEVSLMTSLSYFEGSTEVLKSKGDLARVDFSGYRWNFGFCYYYDFTGKGKK